MSRTAAFCKSLVKKKSIFQWYQEIFKICICSTPNIIINMGTCHLSHQNGFKGSLEKNYNIYDNIYYRDHMRTWNSYLSSNKKENITIIKYLWLKEKPISNQLALFPIFTLCHQYQKETVTLKTYKRSSLITIWILRYPIFNKKSLNNLWTRMRKN